MADRAARLMAVVDLLQARGQLTTGAMAELLGVSERTIRRDLVSLQDLDLPVRATPGRHGGVTIEPGAPVSAALHERRAGGAPARHPHDRGLDRQRARAGRGQRAGPPRERHDAARPGAGARARGRPGRRSGLRERRRLHYASPTSGHTTRDVDPYGLVRLRHWNLAAHCHLRGGLRTFRLDRIKRLETDGPAFAAPDGFDAFAAVASSVALAPFPGSVVCRVRLATDLDAARRRVPPDEVVLEPSGDGVLLSTRYPADALRGFALHLLRLPWPVEILEPAELRDALRGVAARALEMAEIGG